VAEKEKELEEAKKKLSETTQQLEDNGAVIKKLSDDVKSLTDSVKTLMKSNQELQDQKYELSIEKKIDDFKKLGAFPSTIETIKPFLLSEEGKTFSVKLSEKDESGKETGTKTISLAEIIESVLRSIPEEYRLSLDEKSSSVFTPEGTHNKELSEEDVQKYADENKLSYDEALVHFSKLGKI
jgi:uncharacterized protein YktB (UPF0637 family)